MKADEEKTPLTGIAVPAAVSAEVTADVTDAVSVEESAEVTAETAALTARLEEINALDISALSRSEKRELRKEVNEISSQQDRYNRGRHRGHHKNNGYEGTTRYHSSGTIFLVGGSGLLLVLLIILLL